MSSRISPWLFVCSAWPRAITNFRVISRCANFRNFALSPRGQRCINFACLCLADAWRISNAKPAPEGTDPLLWELGQLRKVAQGSLSYAVKTRNLPATASLLRAANGLLDLLARIEKAKAEE